MNIKSCRTCAHSRYGYNWRNAHCVVRYIDDPALIFQDGYAHDCPLWTAYTKSIRGVIYSDSLRREHGLEMLALKIKKENRRFSS